VYYVLCCHRDRPLLLGCFSNTNLLMHPIGFRWSRPHVSLFSFYCGIRTPSSYLQDATRLLNNPCCSDPSPACHFPAVSICANTQPHLNGTSILRFRSFFPDRQPYRLCYVAETSGPTNSSFSSSLFDGTRSMLHQIAPTRHAPLISHF